MYMAEHFFGGTVSRVGFMPVFQGVSRPLKHLCGFKAGFMALVDPPGFKAGFKAGFRIDFKAGFKVQRG